MDGADVFVFKNEAEFTALVKAFREAEQAVGKVTYVFTEKQRKGKDFSRSLYVVMDIKKREVISEKKERSTRPGFCMHPKVLKLLLGNSVKGDLEKGTHLSFDLFI